MTLDEVSAPWPRDELCTIRQKVDLERAKSARAVHIRFGPQEVECWDAFLRATWPVLRELEVEYWFEMTDHDWPETSLRAIVAAAPQIEQLHIRDMPIDLGAESDTLQVLSLDGIRLALPLLCAPQLISLSAKSFKDDTIA